MPLLYNLYFSSKYLRSHHVNLVGNFFYIYLWFRASQIYFIINNQRDATLSSLIYYLLPDHSTCFGCCLHPSSGVHKTVVTTTGISHVSEWCGLKSVKSCQGRVSTSLCHGQIRPSISFWYMTCTSGCNYSFMYSWWWVQRAPEICRVILQ
jgi:hypothetical protein